MKIIEELEARFSIGKLGIRTTGCSEYWSNLSRRQSEGLIKEVSLTGARMAILKKYPELEKIIYSPKRRAGLELLNLSGDEVCIDYGCMWGALTVPLSKMASYVLGIDQTMDSLVFLRSRLDEEKTGNVGLLCADLNSMPELQSKADIALVNGVLEWIPEHGDIELVNYFGQFKRKKYRLSPADQQKEFLNKVCRNLNSNGKIYLAIENRFDYKMFFGIKDPHADLFFVSILPRVISDCISNILLGRPYVNWLYSFKGIESMLVQAGFSKVELFMCFPDYRFPERIIPYRGDLGNFEPTTSLKNMKGKYTWRRVFARLAEKVIFQKLGASFFAPSIIAIGYK